MSDRAQPGAVKSLVRNDELAQIFGQFSDGWIVPGSDPTPAAQRRADIDESALDAFTVSTSTSSLDVTVQPGEAFVGGWVARDVSTDVTLPANNTTEIVLAHDVDAVYDPDSDADRDAADRVVVDTGSNVPSDIPQVVVWTVETDGSGVTAASRGAPVGPTITPEAAPVQSVDGETGDVVLDYLLSSEYTPESDTHDRYTDSEASSAAPVQSVGGETGDVSLQPLLSQTQTEFASFIETSEFETAINTQPLFLSSMVSSPLAMDAVSASSTAMDAVSTSSTAMDAVSASATAMDAVSASSTAMDAVSTSATAMDAVSASATAMDAVFESGVALSAIASVPGASQSVMGIPMTSFESQDRFDTISTALENSSMSKTQFTDDGSNNSFDRTGDNIVLIDSVNQPFRLTIEPQYAGGFKSIDGDPVSAPHIYFGGYTSFHDDDGGDDRIQGRVFTP